MFSHSNSKQTTNTFVLLWCLFTANKPCNDIGRGPNRNPADPLSYGCETVLLRHSISVWEVDVTGTLLTVYHPILVDQSWEQTLFSQALLLKRVLEHVRGPWWWFTVMAHWKRCTFQFVLVFLIGKIIGSRCDGDKFATTLTSTSDLSGCFKHTWKTIGNISWCMASGQIRLIRH